MLNTKQKQPSFSSYASRGAESNKKMRTPTAYSLQGAWAYLEGMLPSLPDDKATCGRPRPGKVL